MVCLLELFLKFDSRQVMTRTCNRRCRRPTPYPLGHGAFASRCAKFRTLACRPVPVAERPYIPTSAILGWGTAWEALRVLSAFHRACLACCPVPVAERPCRTHSVGSLAVRLDLSPKLAGNSPITKPSGTVPCGTAPSGTESYHTVPYGSVLYGIAVMFRRRGSNPGRSGESRVS